ncbi:transcriptional regulator [Kribbella capetownensis]|uniref:Transcriptional regulator n=1 Tax=Kribbella capetownensis TaxID=1572659 RepID=A0A4R0IW12_9ACTN|nr:metalloregulator ArsR/SmtB family transcription factor [Kribbella capetownensis]TCC37397.1 transcriptional regulator [Kribbella capetownensis]
MTVMVDGLHPAASELRLVKVLAALADPARLAMVRTLARNGESPCTQLQDAAGLTIGKSTFSHHQKVLREAGVIQARIQGQQRILTVRRDDLDACFPGLFEVVLDAPEKLIGTKRSD